jgi:hypothetical protein
VIVERVLLDEASRARAFGVGVGMNTTTTLRMSILLDVV